MKDYIKNFENMFDKSWLTEHIINLYKIERKQTFPAYQEAAKYTYDLLKNSGIDAEIIDFPADGKTVYQDKCMPIGWDVSTMKMTLLTPVAGISDPIIADFEKEPLMAVKHSVSTPPEGIVANLVTEAQMLAGEDVRGAFVLLNQAVRPRGEVIRTLLDLGALGWVSDNLEDPHTTPDSVSWMNAGTEHNSWHVQAGDRDFISFQITPRVGLNLRNACEHGPIKVHVVSDGRRYETTFPAVTGLLKGEDSREIWVVSHMYEPLIDDNANGVVGSIALLKAIKQLADEGKIHLRYSIRLVFAGEMYGVAALAEHFGGDLSKRTIGGLNTDGITSSFDKSKNKCFAAKEAPDLPGFAGNIILNKISEQFIENHPDYTIDEWDNYYGDDCFISDSTVGCPCVWIEYVLRGGYHHNSWLDESVFDIDATVTHLAYSAAWVRAMAAMTEEEARALLPSAIHYANEKLRKASTQEIRSETDEFSRMEFLYNREKSKIENLSLWGDISDISKALEGLCKPDLSAKKINKEQDWYEYTANFIFTRLTRGFPHDLVKLPKERRKPMPGSILYNKIANIVSRLDGTKTLKAIIDETEWDLGVIFDESTIKDYFRTLTMLSDAGYLKVEIKNPLNEKDMADAFRKLGISDGETLLVHSALSGLGYLPGGAKTAINALRTAVGENGTILAPAFTRPYIAFEGTLNKNYNYRPYDKRKDGEFRDKNIYTGALPKAMLKEPDMARSNHSTHEWVAIGANATKLTSGHGFLDAPTGVTSPLKKALDADGSVLFLGCGINSNTFIHYVETLVNAPYLQSALVSYIDDDGAKKVDIIKQHLPGHRSFYSAFDGEFYKEAIKRGLHIYEHPFGMATLYRIKLREIYDIAMSMFRENPLATLCSDPNCTYCRKFR